MLQHFLLVAVETELLEDQFIPLDQFACGKPDREASLFGVVFDQVPDRMDRSVNGPAVIFLAAEILQERFLLIFCNVDGVIDELGYALVFGSGNGDDGGSQHGLHFIDIDHAAVSGQFVHHIESYDHGDVHLEELHRQVHIALDIGGIHYVDNGVGFTLKDKIPGNQLFA